ncbi:hypothetical protein ABH15_07970 [Methanoculleus taiwanensis]|uniref:Uncharacterized protein n=2 Tax=Methanoculleus taiwanensis TaxID=1550565 RepID=A0A498H333_9EURY|nr:hypothetical protein ABH15_07970 [Methanoculleus taiwanensis]
MRRYGLVLLSLLVAALLVAPAGAFTADSLDIAVDESGDAEVRFDYSFSWIEQIAVFFKITAPEQELKSALESYSGKPVTIVAVKSGYSVFDVREFAHIRENGTSRVYTLPALDFTAAEKKLKEYWFAPLIEADFSPAVTTVRFPDGYEEKVFDQSAIPSLSHEITA